MFQGNWTNTMRESGDQNSPRDYKIERNSSKVNVWCSVNMLQQTWQEIKYRFDMLRITYGAKVEVYYKT